MTEIVTPYLIEGVSDQEALARLRDIMPNEQVEKMNPERACLLGLDLIRRDRLVALWEDPQTEDELEIIFKVMELRCPLSLVSLNEGAEGHVRRDVSPVLFPLGADEWRLGHEDEPGPVFSSPFAREAVARALEWLAESGSK